MKKKILKFSKQDIADLSQEEQKQIIGGAGTVGANCTVTCPEVIVALASMAVILGLIPETAIVLKILPVNAILNRILETSHVM